MATSKHSSTLVAHRDTLDGAAHALAGLCKWITLREHTPSAVLLALVEQGDRARIALLATLRMRERLDQEGQPGDADMLSRWMTAEEALRDELHVAFVPTDRALATYYAAERFAWQHRPADFAQMTHEEVERWARALAQTFVRAEQPPMTPDDSTPGSQSGDGR